MVEKKFANNIITKYREITPEMEQMIGESPVVSTPMLWLDDTVAQGAFYTECHWLWGMDSTRPWQADKAHTHDFDEVLGFLGSRKENPHDLNAEIELIIEDEKYTITQSCLIFVPKGTKHLPMTFVRIDSPIVFFTTGNGTEYIRDIEEEKQ